MPAVSYRRSTMPSTCTASSMISRVVPACSETSARSNPAAALSRELLQALGRPTSAHPYPLLDRSTGPIAAQQDGYLSVNLRDMEAKPSSLAACSQSSSGKSKPASIPANASVKRRKESVHPGKECAVQLKAIDGQLPTLLHRLDPSRLRLGINPSVQKEHRL